MSFLKKLMATLAGNFNMPDPKSGEQKFREQTERETNLAKERQEQQLARLREQERMRQAESQEETVDLGPLDQ